MFYKIDSVLLVDDDRSANFFHQRLIHKNAWAKEVRSVLNGQEALDYLSQEDKDASPHPDVIFLDLNMPLMSGWEFLDAYQQLNIPPESLPRIFILTTSVNPDDRTKAESYELVQGFYEKFLKKEALADIASTYFTEEEE